MDLKNFNLGFFEKAINRLGEGISNYKKYENHDLCEVFRDSLIQRFNFTYELSHKTLKRFLKCSSANPEEFDGMTFQSLVRSGNERNLLKGDWINWKEYRKMRDKSSHIYDKDGMSKRVEIIPDFLDEACYLRNQIKKELENEKR